MSSYNIENAKKFGDFTVLSSVPNSGIVLVHDGAGVKAISVENLVGPTKLGGAGVHNSIYRGKYLGSSVTPAQYSAIGDGTFDDLFIGDYWTINNVNYRIASFDDYLNAGSFDNQGIHHVVLVPDKQLYFHSMNTSNTTYGGYALSGMRTEGLTQAKEIVNSAFGSSHILKYDDFLSNAVTDGKVTGCSWYSGCTVELMSERKVFGCGARSGDTFIGEVNLTQYPLFAFRPDLITIGEGYWLRDVALTTGFSLVSHNGFSTFLNATMSNGVRPSFAICQQNR